MTSRYTGSPSAALASAVSWVCSTSGWSSRLRSPRTPSAGFGSSAGVRKSSGLSAPGVQHPHDHPPLGEGLSTCAVRLDLLLLGRRLLAVVEEEELGTEQADALGTGLTAPPARRRGRRCWPAAAPCARRRWHRARSTRTARPSARPPPRSSSARFSSLGSTKISPVLPSTAMTVPSASSPAPGSATTAGTPSARARIALWLVGPPSSVTKPSTSVGSSSAVSAGARSRAIST